MSDAVAELSTHTFLCTVQREDGAGLLLTAHDASTRGGTEAVTACDFQKIDVVLDASLLDSRASVQISHERGAALIWGFLDGGLSGAAIVLEGAGWSGESASYVICAGELGRLRQNQDDVTLDIVVTPPALEEQPCVRTSPECRARLGDKACRVSLRPRTRRLVLSKVEGSWLRFEAEDLGPYAFGRLQWLSGRNCGLSQDILQADGGSLQLREPSRFPPDTGARVRLTEGCDGRLGTCRERFGNVANFRGEPHMPGTDFLLRYPGD